MQNIVMQKVNRWLLPAVLILFILQLVMLPWAVGFTWADRSDAAAHTLTYTENKLTWDSATGIRADGSAELNLFSSAYGTTVEANNGDKLVAPGTGKDMYIRLKNNVSGSVTYTAVLYAIKTDDRIPVEAALSGNNLTDTASYTLPSGVQDAHVIRAVTGSLGGNQIQDFDISWLWEFEENGTQDAIDTLLGDMDTLPEVTVGFYLVVEDNNSYVIPDIPQTGDNSHIGLYFGLMLISFIMLILLLLDRRREAKRESN